MTPEQMFRLFESHQEPPWSRGKGRCVMCSRPGKWVVQSRPPLIGLACHGHAEALMQQWYEVNEAASRRPFVLPWRTWLMYHTWLASLFMRQHRDR